ncbi:hypothetical protein R1sor_001340 [Riccia sorocarpa]|uniref:PIN-like protein n=1 Tax=Riccia sorocarpa TaxID=122646 RepID=A0ABD3GWJ0_9MARC
MAINGTMSLEKGIHFMMQVETTFERESDVITNVVVVPVLKVLTMGALGAILSHPKIHMIKPMTTQLLSKLVFALFLPCLIFSELGAAVTLENMMSWWFIPVNVILSTVIGCLVGVVVAVICRPPPRFYRFVIVMTGIGVAYIAFSTWIAVIIVYTFVYHMLEPPEYVYEEVPALLGEDYEVDEDTQAEIQLVADFESNTDVLDSETKAVDAEEGKMRPSVLEAEWPGLQNVSEQNDHFRKPVLGRFFRGESMTSQASLLSDDDDVPGKAACMKEPRMVKRLRRVAQRTPLEHILQPPTIASLLAIAVGLFPHSKGVIFGADAPLEFVDDTFDILALAMVPCCMLVLGGSLSGGPGKSKSELGLKTTIGICVARLLVIPLIGIGVVQGAEYLGYFPAGDQMFKFVLFLHYTMPTAILCGAMASLRGYGESEAAALMFWQHILAAFSITLYIAIYLNLLSYI